MLESMMSLITTGHATGFVVGILAHAGYGWVKGAIAKVEALIAAAKAIETKVAAEAKAVAAPALVLENTPTTGAPK